MTDGLMKHSGARRYRAPLCFYMFYVLFCYVFEISRVYAHSLAFCVYE